MEVVGVPSPGGGFVQRMMICTCCGGLTFSLVVLTLLECIVLMLFGDSSLLPFCTLWTCEGQSCNGCPLSACRHLWINIFRWGPFAPPHDFPQKNHHLVIGPKKFCQMIKKQAVGAVVVLNNNSAPPNTESLAVHQPHHKFNKFWINFRKCSKNQLPCLLRVH